MSLWRMYLGGTHRKPNPRPAVTSYSTQLLYPGLMLAGVCSSFTWTPRAKLGSKKATEVTGAVLVIFLCVTKNCKFSVKEHISSSFYESKIWTRELISLEIALARWDLLWELRWGGIYFPILVMIGRIQFPCQCFSVALAGRLSPGNFEKFF